MKTTIYKEFEEQALAWIKEADRIALKHFNLKASYQIKEDGSPVTEADLEIERFLVEKIKTTYPDHSVLGEEYASQGALNSEYCWVIDPIDGTQSFAAGIPTFGILLALRYKESSVVGIVSYPALEKVYSASLGNGARLNQEAISIKDARTNYEIFASSTKAYSRSADQAIFDRLIDNYPYTRIYYDCFPFGLLAQGKLAALVEYNLRLWDIAPLEILLKESGGEVRYLPQFRDKDGSVYYRLVAGRAASVSKILQFLSSS